MSASRILFIDAYDSFSNNIISLLQRELGVQVDTIKIDDGRFVLNDDAFRTFLQRFDAIVAGPGPGHPGNKNDVGLIGRLWTLPNEYLLPVLGICLGFQSLCFSQGAIIERLSEPRHGIVTPVTHRHGGIFAGIKDVHATQYHSLHARICAEQISFTDSGTLWQPHSTCNKLMPLAWDLSDAKNGPILMAAQHVERPFVGTQFHPESICTNVEGKRLIRNWWQSASVWNDVRERRTIPPSINGRNGHLQPPGCASSTQQDANLLLDFRKIEMSSLLNMTELVQAFRTEDSSYEPILLQSGLVQGKPINGETGRYSIIGLHDDQSERIRYVCDRRQLEYGKPGATQLQDDINVSDMFAFLDDFMKARQAKTGPKAPFWGGLVGFISYEAGLASIDVPPSSSISNSTDVWFVMVERSIVIDHVEHCAYIQSIRSKDKSWIDDTVELVNSVTHPPLVNASSLKHASTVLSTPVKDEYCKQVDDCQAHLRAGSSYELCLTDQTTLTTATDAWTMYKRLSTINPAPFGAYLRFQGFDKSQSGVSIVGSSPERFLNWSREGKCQFRPIKGTVPRGPGATKAKAEAILKSKKEQAENLMIVDLIRHDLSGVSGVTDVNVSSLMAIEEYATVFQLVSVIEGQTSPDQSGVNVLAASLPPGSMTGAPKRRSCELLKSIERDQPRSIYSGVIGYLDIGGAGDFSVVIRTAFKWDTEDVWRVGAGGAVTILSTAEGEYDEMITKRERLITAFS